MEMRCTWISPNELEKYYLGYHAKLIAEVIKPASLKMDNFSHSFIKSTEVSMKNYMEAYCLSPVEDLVDFHANLVAKKVLVLDTEWWDKKHYRGIIRSPLETYMSGCPVLMSDASIVDDLGFAGGVVSVWAHGRPIEYHCGKLPYITKPTGGTLCHQEELHPLGNKVNVIYELMALIHGLQFNARHLNYDRLMILVDNQELVKVLSGYYCIPENEYYQDFMKAISELRRIRYTIRHVYREGNLFSDRLAFVAMANPNFTVANCQDWDVDFGKNSFIASQFVGIEDVYRKFHNVLRFYVKDKNLGTTPRV